MTSSTVEGAGNALGCNVQRLHGRRLDWYVASRATEGLTNGDMFTSYQLCKGKNTLSSNSLDASSVCRYTRDPGTTIRCHVIPGGLERTSDTGRGFWGLHFSM